MTSGRTPTASEVLDLLDRLQCDEARRGVLASSWEIYRTAVGEGVIGEDGIDWLAERMKELVDEGLIAFGAASGGVLEPPRWEWRVYPDAALLAGDRRWSRRCQALSRRA
jgi:hypothetical protein